MALGERVKVYRVRGFSRYFAGHYVPILVPDELPSGEVARTDLFAGAGSDGELTLQRALAAPVNASVLRQLAGAGESARVGFVVREFGGSGRIDVGAQIDAEGALHLLLVDCKDAGPRTSKNLRERYCNWLLNALEAIQHSQIPHTIARWILLAGWAPGCTLPPSARTFPAGNASWAQSILVAPPEWCGIVCVRIADAEFVAVGPWRELDEASWLPRGRGLERIVGRTRHRVGVGKWSGTLELRSSRGPVRVSLLLDKSERQEVLSGSGGSIPARIRSLCQAEPMALGGWEYVGETNDKGKCRLHWESKSHESMDVEIIDGFTEALVGALRPSPQGRRRRTVGKQ